MKRVCVAAAVAWLVGGVLVAAPAVRAEVLTLDQCIQMALTTDGSSGYGLPQARVGYHQAKQNVWSAWGALLPRISHGYNYSYQKQPSTVVYDETTGEYVPASGQSSVHWSTGFSLQHSLFDGGANVYQLSQAYHNRTAQREQLRGSENQLVLGVKEAYFSLLKAQRLAEVQKKAVERAEQFHKTINSKYELGSASLSEVLKARVELGSAQLGLVQNQNAVETARAELNTILNRTVDEPLEIADVGDSDPAVPSYDQAVDAALTRSPGVLASRAGLRAAKDDLGIARANFFPTFSWSLSRSYAPQRRQDLLDFSKDYGSWSAGASLSFTLFDAFHHKTSLSNARVGLKYAREELEQTERAATLSIKQQYLSVQLAQETRRLAEQTEASAQEDFNLAQEKYNLGAATILDLLDAQVSLTTAQTDKVNALFDYHIAVARLENAMGGGR